MERTRIVHIYTVLEAEIPMGFDTRNLNLGLAGSKIMKDWDILTEAKLHTWWIEKVKVCNSQYITCPKCNEIALLSHDAVILDGKPLCIHCTSAFQYGDAPVKRTKEDIELLTSRNKNQFPTETAQVPSDYQRGLSEAWKTVFDLAKARGYNLNPNNADMSFKNLVEAFGRAEVEKSRSGITS